jgi:hypothetical protein
MITMSAPNNQPGCWDDLSIALPIFEGAEEQDVIGSLWGNGYKNNLSELIEYIAPPVKGAVVENGNLTNIAAYSYVFAARLCPSGSFHEHAVIHSTRLRATAPPQEQTLSGGRAGSEKIAAMQSRSDQKTAMKAKQ